MDVPAIQQSLAGGASTDLGPDTPAQQLGAAIGHIIVDTCAIVDPELVLLGGPLGSHPALLTTARATVAALSPAPVRVELGALGEKASLQGALHLALDRARERLLATIIDDVPPPRPQPT
jgi:predicted NBD/HSP70 family sugar kinase